MTVKAPSSAKKYQSEKSHNSNKKTDSSDLKTSFICCSGDQNFESPVYVGQHENWHITSYTCNLDK